MTEQKEDLYFLPRDWQDNNRINLQHYLWIELFGYYIHPSIPKDAPNLKIADLGAGTAIWLTDMSRRLPKTAELDGLDITFEQAPPKEWLPDNVKFRYWDILTDVPDELAGRYDIINMRAMIWVVPESKIVETLKRVVRLLKPGGYLQWTDSDVPSFRVEKSNPSNDEGPLMDLFKLIASQSPSLSPKYVPQLSKYFAEAGLEDIKSEAKDASGDLALAKHECSLMVHEQVARKTKNKDFLDKLQTVLPAAAKATREGSVMSFTRWFVVGRKPE